MTLASLWQAAPTTPDEEMNTRTLAAFFFPIVVGIAACATPAAQPGATAPQASNAAGYGMSLVSINPPAGTRLAPGQVVTFSATVTYHLEVADSGEIVLAPQDEVGTSLVHGRRQAFTPVGRGTGQ